MLFLAIIAARLKPNLGALRFWNGVEAGREASPLSRRRLPLAAQIVPALLRAARSETWRSGLDPASPGRLSPFIAKRPAPVRCLAPAPNRRRCSQQTLGLCEREASRSHILSHI
jgi:hypothetical protein